LNAGRPVWNIIARLGQLSKPALSFPVTVHGPGLAHFSRRKVPAMDSQPKSKYWWPEMCACPASSGRERLQNWAIKPHPAWSLVLIIWDAEMKFVIYLSMLSAVGSAFAQDEPKPQIAATYSDVSYGVDKRNVLDFGKADGGSPRPLLVHIHGGGWVAGDKKQDTNHYKPFLDKGISCAAINYRLTPGDPLPAPAHDAARVIPFLRTKATEWNIDTFAGSVMELCATQRFHVLRPEWGSHISAQGTATRRQTQSVALGREHKNGKAL
jgi:hypothetical protein